MDKQVYRAKDIGELLGVSESKSYELIRFMNAELQRKGFLTLRGRVPAAYVRERFFGLKAAGQEDALGTYPITVLRRIGSICTTI